MNLCILIPTYNDKNTLPSMIERLLPAGYPILIVDDASSPEAAGVIDDIAAAHPEVSVIHRPVNGGKGAAVADGIARLHDSGYSHALQIDADDQHCIADMPRFVAAARLSPEALVLGVPVFSADVPAVRLLGRQISRFWVVLETLSTAIRDPLFGYRVYPVASAHRLLRRVRLGKRMDFDPEVAVRLYWQGLDIVNIATPVRYPEGGISRFRILRDNLRISWMHMRLFLGMFVRLPRLIRRWF
jgi:glycosyltransferase involved in cell wall biosynthesis